MSEQGLGYKICVSGAAETAACGHDALQKAVALGKEVVRQKAILIDGATTGFPFWAAKGAKEVGGIVVGVSPASTEAEHVKVYGLPIEFHDLILYTGSGYSGRNLLLTRLTDAVIIGCGRIGTINEFTIAFEDRKPIGILRGAWDTDELLETIVKKSHRAEEMAGKIFYSDDPKELVAKLIASIAKERETNYESYLRERIET
ncbi:LOG family protein [Candidatus Wolfebacteria bacterium]|nr:LOG family protein [Candidatus Wolfebacteria bacterium]